MSPEICFPEFIAAAKFLLNPTSQKHMQSTSQEATGRIRKQKTQIKPIITYKNKAGMKYLKRKESIRILNLLRVVHYIQATNQINQ